MIAYFDASALLKIVTEEPGTDRARELWYEHSRRVTSRMTYAEARSAIARACARRRIPQARIRATRERLERRWDQLSAVEVTDGVVRLAGDIAERHLLRGYDAVHLASALTLKGTVVMGTWDRDLHDAAAVEGLATLTI